MMSKGGVPLLAIKQSYSSLTYKNKFVFAGVLEVIV
jgi:hypothetical protein